MSDVSEDLRSLAPAVRRDLLRVLTSPSHIRADVIRQFFDRPGGREMADVLIDLEEDDVLRFSVIEELRALEQTSG
jgi:hypothetical protein